MEPGSLNDQQHIETEGNVKAYQTMYLSTPVWNDVWFKLK